MLLEGRDNTFSLFGSGLMGKKGENRRGGGKEKDAERESWRKHRK